MRIFTAATLVLALSAIAADAYGTTVTLNSVADTWIAYGSGGSYSTTPRDTDTTINVRSGSTASNASTSAMRELGVMEFDLNQLPAGATITGAYIQMFYDTGFGNFSSGNGTDKARLIQLSNNPISNTANNSNINPGLDWGPTNINPSTLTYKTAGATQGYSDYVAPPGTPTFVDTLQTTDFLTHSFGWYNFSTTTVQSNAYTPSASADADDLAYIQGVYNDSWKKLGVMLDPQSSLTSGAARTLHYWASSRDPNFPSLPWVGPQLVVTYTLAPEPSTFVLGAVGIASVFGLSRVRRNKQL